MSVSIPTVDLDAIAQGDDFKGMRKALYGRLKDTYALVSEFGAQLMAQRNQRDKAAELFEASENADDVEAREIRAKGLDKIDSLQEQIDQINSDINALVEARIAAVATSGGLSQEELETASEAYKLGVSGMKDFAKIFPETAGIKFPGVTQLVTGKGALRSGDASPRFSAWVDYNGTRYDSISLAAIGAKVDNALITSKLISQLGQDTKLDVDQVQTVVITDNGVDKTFTLTGKAQAKRGRKPKSDSTAEVSDSTVSDEFDNDSDDESDTDF